MELEDLRQAWEEQAGKLEDSVRLNGFLLHQAIGANIETRTQRLSRWLWVELIGNFIAAVLLGSFLADNLTVPRFAIPAAVLDVLTIGLLIAGVRQLAAISRIDYGQPVLVIQKRLGSLRAERIRATMATLVLAPLAWIPLFIVVLKGLFGVDAYAIFSSAWLAANVLLGVVVVAAAIFASRRHAARVTSSASLQWLMDNLAGRSLQNATSFLRSLSQYEHTAG